MKTETHTKLLDDIAANVLTGKKRDVKDLCLRALDENIPPVDILDNGLLKGMNEATQLFRDNKILITHILLAASAMEVGTGVLASRAPKADDLSSGAFCERKVVIGTIKGDLHDIGKNIVKLMLENNGFSVIDLGVDVEPHAFIDTAIDEGARVVACSALLTTAMRYLAEVVEYAGKKGVRDSIKIMIGGAPVTQNFADTIGADAYTEDAAKAVEKAKEFYKE